jgi:hypothetical protein
MANDPTAVLTSMNEFSVEPDREAAESNSLGFIYWRRKDGWITYGPGWPIEMARLVTKGETPLRQYGEFFMFNPELPVVRDGMRIGVIRKWRPNADPFRLILLAGGAGEFPLSQIEELGWHRKSPIGGVTFPQLDGYVNHDVKCPTCQKLFLSQDNLLKHESIAHSTVSQQTSLARSIADATTAQNEPLAKVMIAMAEQISAQGAALAKIVERMETPAKKAS